MADVLFVSKAVAPPWNDSGKNLVRDLARGLRRHRATLMVGEHTPAELPDARFARVYRGAVGFAPALRDQARVFAHLLTGPRHPLWHFFFAPNPRSCVAGRAAKRLRSVACVHTVSSAPRDPHAVVPLLFAEMNVVLSAHTERRLLAAGLDARRLARIPPAIVPLTPIDPARQRALRVHHRLPTAAPVVVFPGDLEFGQGAPLMIEVTRALRRDVHLVMACRTKTPRAREAERALRDRCAAWGLAERVMFVGETPHIHELLACADVVALPSVDLYAKMDYPLVLLEAMSLERSVIVARGSAAEELSEEGAALALSPDVESVCAALERLLDDAEGRAELGSQARRSVCERYGYATMAAAYERLYDQLLA